MDSTIKTRKPNKTKSLLFTTICYIVALLGAYFAFTLCSGIGPIWSVLVADLVGTCIIFFLGLIWNNASLYDPYWSVAPVPMAIYWWSITDFELSFSKIALSLVILYWSIRLTLNWARSWSGFDHEDWRYGNLRKQTGKAYPLVNLTGIHVFPTILVFLGMLPTYFVYVNTGDSDVLLDVVAFLMGITAVTIELTADEQLKKFVKSNQIKRAFLKTGLWKYSRHPNYFGEVSFWFSLFLFGISTAGEQALWTAVGFISMFCLFWFISIPMMDKRMMERRDGFEEYMNKTSRLFLLPTKD